MNDKNDDETYEVVLSGAFDLNHSIDRLLGDKHDKSARKNESFVVNSPVFLRAVENARVKFNIRDEVIEDGEAIILIMVFVRDKYPKLKSYQETMAFINQEISKILEVANLTEHWRPYVEEFVVNRRPTTSLVMGQVDKIRATKVSKDKVTLELKPGLRREDYVNAWKAIAPYLGPAKQLEKPYSNPEQDADMYQDRTKGLAFKELAKKYYPKEYANNEIDTIEMVKKRVQRYKLRYQRDITSEAS